MSARALQLVKLRYVGDSLSHHLPNDLHRILLHASVEMEYQGGALPRRRRQVGLEQSLVQQPIQPCGIKRLRWSDAMVTSWHSQMTRVVPWARHLAPFRFFAHII